MSFVSKAWSTDTLDRGLGLVLADPLSMETDPDPDALRAELRRLEEASLGKGWLF